MKTQLFCLVLSIGLSLTAVAQQRDLNVLSDEIGIMRGILTTTLKKPHNTTHINVRDIDALYLWGQGVAFEITTNNWDWSLGLEHHGAPPMPPKPRRPPQAPLQVFVTDGLNIELEEDWQSIAQDALSMAQDAMREARDDLRELRESEHELAWEKRDLERRKRELNFAKRTADDSQIKSLEQELEQIGKALEKVTLKQQQVAEYAQEMQAEQQRKASEKQAAISKYQTAFLATFESEVVDVLCRYGSGFRSLASNEHISFVLKDFSRENSSAAKKDQIYVFNHQDIVNCARDKISSEVLLKQAHRYLM